MRNILAILTLITALSVSTPSTADGEQDKIFRVREGFIYNFLKFVEWPDAHSFPKGDGANVCIMGDHLFAEHFMAHQPPKMGEIALHVREMISYNDLRLCHILFIGETEEKQVTDILARVMHHSVLTISEAKHFAEQGGIIEIAATDTQIGLFSKGKVNLRINLKSAKEDGLAIDARLLQIAEGIIK